jgi:hypothetical protein
MTAVISYVIRTFNLWLLQINTDPDRSRILSKWLHRCPMARGFGTTSPLPSSADCGILYNILPSLTWEPNSNTVQLMDTTMYVPIASNPQIN